jgi:hypothetical protein
MGIWRGSGFGEGWFSQERRELKAADDRGLGVAAVLDGLIEDRSAMPCRRLQAPGRNRRAAENGMFRRMDAATSGRG